MDRRTFVRLLGLAGAACGVMGHSPYRQWQAYRKSRLIIVTSAAEPASYRAGRGGRDAAGAAPAREPRAGGARGRLARDREAPRQRPARPRHPQRGRRPGRLRGTRTLRGGGRAPAAHAGRARVPTCSSVARTSPTRRRRPSRRTLAEHWRRRRQRRFDGRGFRGAQGRGRLLGGDRRRPQRAHRHAPPRHGARGRRDARRRARHGHQAEGRPGLVLDPPALRPARGPVELPQGVPRASRAEGPVWTEASGWYRTVAERALGP